MRIQLVFMKQRKNGSSKHTPHDRHSVSILLNDIPAINLKKNLINGDKYLDVLGELIAVSETAFAFIRYSELDEPVKNAMYQLERQFEFYRRLLDQR